MFPAMCLVSVAKFRNSARLEPKRYNSKNMHNMNHIWSVTNVTMDLILVEMLYERGQVFSMTVCHNGPMCMFVNTRSYYSRNPCDACHCNALRSRCHHLQPVFVHQFSPAMISNCSSTDYSVYICYDSHSFYQLH